MPEQIDSADLDVLMAGSVPVLVGEVVDSGAPGLVPYAYDKAPATALIERRDALVPYVTEQQLKLESLIRELQAQAAAAALMTVTSPESKAAAVRLMRDVKGSRAEAVAVFKPVKQSIDGVKQIALNMEKFFLGLADGPVAVLTGRVMAFDREVAAEAARRQREAIDAERRRLQAIADAERQAAAVRAQEEADAAALIAAHFGEPEPEPVAVVETATPAIDEELLELAAMEAAAPEPEKVAGFGYTTVTHFAVDDFKALVADVAAGKVPLDALQPNETHIRQQAGKMGVDLGYAGVRVWTTQDPRVRR